MAEFRLQLPVMTRAQEAISKCQSRFVCVAGGETSGMTTLALDAALMHPAAGAMYGHEVAYIAKDKGALTLARRKMIRQVERVMSFDGAKKNRVTLITGGHVDFFSVEQGLDTLGQYRLVVWDDAHAVDDADDIWEDVVRLAVAKLCGYGWVFGRSSGATAGFYRLFSGAQEADGWGRFVLPTSQNRHFPAEALEKARGSMSDGMFRLRFEGEFSRHLIEMAEGCLNIPENMTFRQWCESLAEKGMKVDGKPFSLDDRPALIPIYDAIPTRKEDAKKRVLVIQKATQLGLTVWEVLANIYMAVKWEPVTIGMFMPTQSVALYKSAHRFMRIVRSAPDVYRLLTTGKDVSGKSVSVGEGNKLTRKVGDSLLLFLWTTGKVTTESIPMDVVTLDEVQEMKLDQIDKVRARTGDSDIAFMVLLSTSNLPDLDIDHWYRKGNQEVWHTECPECGAFSDLSDPASNFPDKSIGYDNARREYFWRCPVCGAEIADAQQGKYIVTNPNNENPLIRSFLLPRTLSPKFTPREMIENWRQAKTGDQKKSFYNRTLARPYIDAEQLPVTMAHCVAAAAAGALLGLKWKTTARDTYMGIDQMGGFNAVVIKERLPDGRQAYVHAEAVFDIDPFGRCAALMEQYGVTVCVVEQLPNVNDARKFANQFPGRVFLCGYSDMRDDSMQWGDDLSASDRKTSEEDRTRYTVNINQYKCMQTSLYRIRGTLVDGKLVPMCLFPDPDELVQDVVESGKNKRIVLMRDWVFVHFTKTALVVEQDDEQRKAKAKVMKIGIDPHFAFANMLCDVAWARSHGTGMMLFAETAPVNEVRSAVEAAMPGLPGGVVDLFDVRQDVCGRCSSFVDGSCSERGFSVGARDAACMMFTPI